MSDAVTLMRAFVAYFEGVNDSLGPKGVPSKVQWGRISERVEAMGRLLHDLPVGEPVNGHRAAVEPAADKDVDPTPGGTKVTADWLANVKKALVELGIDEESVGDYMRDKRFRVDLNVMPGDYAQRIEAGTY